LLLARVGGRVVRSRPTSAVVSSKGALAVGQVWSFRVRRRSRVARVAPRGPPRRVTSIPRRLEVVEVSRQRWRLAGSVTDRAGDRETKIASGKGRVAVVVVLEEVEAS